MNYASIRTCDIANGEGVRVTLFVSGCTHRCKGCFNPDQWDFGYGKPFDRKVLLARIRSVLRRGLPVTEGVDFDGLVIDEVAKVAKLNGKALELTAGEFALLTRLVAHRGRIMQRAADERTVDVQIAKLRQKLGAWAEHIETVRGIGYRVK